MDLILRHFDNNRITTLDTILSTSVSNKSTQSPDMISRQFNPLTILVVQIIQGILVLLIQCILVLPTVRLPKRFLNKLEILFKISTLYSYTSFITGLHSFVSKHECNTSLKTRHLLHKIRQTSSSQLNSGLDTFFKIIRNLTNLDFSFSSDMFP